VIIDPRDLELDPLTREEIAKGPDRNRDKNLETLAELAARPRTEGARRIVLHFLVSPVEIVGRERVEALTVTRNELYRSTDGALRARASGDPVRLDVDLVFRAIGYQGVPLAGLPFDPGAGVIPNAAGRVVDPQTATPVAGEYVVGWIKRGPRGIIGTNKPDSYETVEALLEDLRAGRLAKDEVPTRSVLERLLGERRGDFVSYEDWQLIDLLEQERGREQGARPRLKFSRIDEMLAALRERKQAERATSGEG
jgi:ferredoxin/flavodoxin---NADP+ reductase